MDLTLDGAGVRIHEQFLRVVAQTLRGVPGAPDAEAVALTDTHAFNETEPPTEGVLEQGHSLLGGTFGVTRVEEAEVDRFGVAGIHAHLDAPVHDGDARWGRQVARDAHDG